MATRDPFETLHQLRDFAIEARDLSAGRQLDDLFRDRGFLRHAERVTELIGEAVTRLPDEVRSAWPEVPWRQMISMRNWLIHGYDGIDAEILWDVLSKRAEELIAQLDVIIAEWDPQ